VFLSSRAEIRAHLSRADMALERTAGQLTGRHGGRGAPLPTISPSNFSGRDHARLSAIGCCGIAGPASRHSPQPWTRGSVPGCCAASDPQAAFGVASRQGCRQAHMCRQDSHRVVRRFAGGTRHKSNRRRDSGIIDAFVSRKPEGGKFIRRNRRGRRLVPFLRTRVEAHRGPTMRRRLQALPP